MSSMTFVTGREIASLMRKHRTTIRELAQRMQITQKRIRQVRECGLEGPELSRDWIQAITGVDPGPSPNISSLLNQKE